MVFRVVSREGFCDDLICTFKRFLGWWEWQSLWLPVSGVGRRGLSVRSSVVREPSNSSAEVPVHQLKCLSPQDGFLGQIGFLSKPRTAFKNGMMNKSRALVYLFAY